MWQFIRGIPTSLDEAARLDGANSFTIYRRIKMIAYKEMFTRRPWTTGSRWEPVSALPTLKGSTRGTDLLRRKGMSR